MKTDLSRLNSVKDTLAALEQQLDEHKQRARKAKEELAALEAKERDTNQAYQDALSEFAAGAVSEPRLDDAERQLDDIRGEIEKRRPRLNAVIKACETVPAELVGEIEGVERESRVIIAEYWNNQRKAIEEKAREALPLLKLWVEVCNVDIELEVRAAALPPLEMPLDSNALTCRKLLTSDRDSAKRGR